MAWTTAGNTIGKITGILYTALVLSQLSVYEYGLTELVITIPPLLAFLNVPGLEIVVASDMAYQKGRAGYQKMMQIFTSYAALRAALALVGFVTLFGSASFIESSYNNAIAMMVQVISFTFLTSPIRTVLLIVFQVEASTRTHINETRQAHLDQLHDSAVTLNQVRGISSVPVLEWAQKEI